MANPCIIAWHTLPAACIPLIYKKDAQHRDGGHDNDYSRQMRSTRECNRMLDMQCLNLAFNRTLMKTETLHAMPERHESDNE